MPSITPKTLCTNSKIRDLLASKPTLEIMDLGKIKIAPGTQRCGVWDSRETCHHKCDYYVNAEYVSF